MTEKGTQFDIKAFRKQLEPREYEHTTLCLVRAATDEFLEASFDFGSNWIRLPMAEVVSATVLKTVDLPKARYPLVRLVMDEEHPGIELAAVSAQLVHMQTRSQAGCSCSDSDMGPSAIAPRKMEQGPRWTGSCLELCAPESGCDFWSCVYWCAFLR